MTFGFVKCMCRVGDNFFFLGSRLADSLLVQHTSGSASVVTPSLNIKPEREEVNPNAKPFLQLELQGEVALPCFRYKFGLFLVLQQVVSLFWQQGDIEGDLAPPAAKRLKRTASDDTQEGVSAEEMSLYYSSPTSSDTSQVF